MASLPNRDHPAQCPLVLSLFSYRDLEEMMLERGLAVDHSTINCWVLQYSPKLDMRIRRHLKRTNDSWRVDETYVKFRKKWQYLY